MARFNEIQVGRYNRYLQKLLSMKGDAVAPTLSPEISPHFLLEDIGVEIRYLLGWDLFGVAVSQPAVALVQSGVRVRNPLGSNVVVVLEKITVMGGSSEALSFSRATISTDLATVVALGNQRLDARSRPSPTLILSRDASGAVGDLATLISTGGVSAANVPFDYVQTDHQEIPILPGDAMQFIGTLVNTALLVGLRWRERFLEDSERA